jgi:hypothetical protein
VMFPFPNPIDLFGDAASAIAGWSWDKVIDGMYTWFANGLLLLMEWVWRVLDAASTPRLTEAWFTGGLARPLAGLAVAITVALMLASAIQAGFGGRPELIVDALKEGPKAIVATALTVTVIDVLLRGADVLADVVWQTGRGDTQQVLDGLARTISMSGSLGATFLGPLALSFGMISLLVTAVMLFMRSALLYLVAAFAPVVWSASVSPVLRGAGRRLVQVTVALVLAKPAIVITLVVGSKLVANTATPSAGGSDGAAALGTLVTGFACFGIAGLSPWIIFRLLPTVEGAAVSSGIVGGWGRSAMTTAQTAMMVKTAGASGAASAATRGLPSAAGSPGTSSTPAAGPSTTPTGGGGSRSSSSAATTRPPAPPLKAPGGGRRPAMSGDSPEEREEVPT